MSSRNAEEHVEHLQALFDRLEANHLTINLEKCVLGCSTVTFLGYKFNSEGIQPLPEKEPPSEASRRPPPSRTYSGSLAWQIFIAIFCLD